LHPLGFTIEIVPTIRTFEVDHVEVLVTDVKFDDFLAGRARTPARRVGDLSCDVSKSIRNEFKLD
jgi:hypothetical protein